MARRRFVLLSVLTVLGAACGAPAETGLRGNGTVLRPREVAEVQSGSASTHAAEHASEPVATVRPTLAPIEDTRSAPIVPSDALPTSTAGTDTQQYVAPALTGRPPLSSVLPARRVVIPSIGVDSKVIQLGTKIDRRGQIAWETAPFAVGQHKGLAGPGQTGNMVLSGHISSPHEGAVFGHLPALKPGEGVIVATEERQFLYRVVDVQTVTPDRIEVLDQTPDATATLITCVPDGIYSHRLVVTARLV